MHQTPTVVAVCGNPRPGSRTRTVADAVAGAIAGRLAAPPPATIELSDLAGQLLVSEHPEADAALVVAARATVLVVATPTYKATYTGLLKAFLDLYRGPGLAGVIAVPVQVAGQAAHLLAAEVHLRPLLVELGATVPTRAFTLEEAQLGSLDELVLAWVQHEGATLQAATKGRTRSDEQAGGRRGR